MSALEDITYSNDEEDVGAEADFSNLETSIIISPIPTTRVYKDHPVAQIIGDLSSASQTRSMTRMVKDQGGLTQINDEDFHTCMFACFFLKKNPIGYTKHSKILVGLKLGRRSFFNSRCKRGKIDQTLFIKKQKGNILLVRVYVDYIIFGSTNKELCKAFEKLMKDKFQMSLMGELTFFLGLQVKQKEDGIFISQDKYVAEILRKSGLTDGKSASIPIDTEKPLLKDPNGEDVDVHTYRIFRYLKGKPHFGLWYPKDSPFNLIAYSDSDYAGASLDRKSTTGGCQFLGCRLISWQCTQYTVVATSSTKAEYVAAYALMDPTIYVSCIKQFWTSIFIKKSNDVVRLQVLIDRRKVIITEDSIRQALRLEDADGVDCLPNEEIFTELARMGYESPSTKLTFYKAFFSAQWKFLIHIILKCMSAKRTAWNEFSSSMASTVICLATVGDLSSHNTKCTSRALTQKVFANMRRIGKGFSGVDTPLFDGMLVQQQVQDVEDAAEDEDNANEVSAELTPTSPTPATPPPSPTQEHIPSPPQAQTAQPSSPPQPQPSQTADISMTLLNQLLETCATLTGFAAVLAVLKPERLKADRAWNE
nr:hypothetical protein [Tanacetum cinerariifolium]